MVPIILQVKEHDNYPGTVTTVGVILAKDASEAASLKAELEPLISEACREWGRRDESGSLAEFVGKWLTEDSSFPDLNSWDCLSVDYLDAISEHERQRFEDDEEEDLTEDDIPY